MNLLLPHQHQPTLPLQQSPRRQYQVSRDFVSILFGVMEQHNNLSLPSMDTLMGIQDGLTQQMDIMSYGHQFKDGEYQDTHTKGQSWEVIQPQLFQPVDGYLLRALTPLRLM